MMTTIATPPLAYIGDVNRYGTVELWGDPAADRWSVVSFDADHNQVYSLLDADHPLGGGQWMAHRSTDGVAYVARARTWRTVSRMLRAHQDEWINELHYSAAELVTIARRNVRLDASHYTST